MKWYRHAIVLFLLPLFLTGSIARAASLHDTIPIKASIDSFNVHYFTGNFYQKATRSDSYELKDFQKYYNRSCLSTIGQPVNHYFADEPLNHTGFHYYKNDFSDNLISEDSIRYYDAHRPYTKLFFLAGQNKEAGFSFIHSQNVNKNLNFTGYFKRIRCDSIYRRERTNLTNIYVSSNYKSPNKRYFLMANVIYNIDKPDVNGGLKTDTSLTNPDRPPNPKLLPVNLKAADRRYRNRSISINQFFNLGHSEQPPDSSMPASFNAASAFSLHFQLGDESIVYHDLNPDSGFYQNVYLNHKITRDSINIQYNRNSIGWNTWEKNTNGSKRHIGLYVNAGNEWIRLHQINRDTVFMNWIANAGIFNYTDSNSFFRAKLTGEYCFGGYNAGDYRADLSIKQVLVRKVLDVGALAQLSSHRPDYMTLDYGSNNFMWKNDFGKESISSLSAYIRSPRYFFETGVFSRRYANAVYYDQFGIPQQFEPGVSLNGAYISKDLHLGRSWTFANRITYQYSSNDAVFSFPTWITEHSLYFHHEFKDKLTYQVGLDAFYFSAYYSKAYMPATGQFYQQFNTQIGNYPFVDFYVSMQIKTVRIFVKYEHVNSGIPNYNYFLATHYPAPGRALKLGLSWIFNN
jgi:hypothetical protein